MPERVIEADGLRKWSAAGTAKDVTDNWKK